MDHKREKKSEVLHRSVQQKTLALLKGFSTVPAKF